MAWKTYVFIFITLICLGVDAKAKPHWKSGETDNDNYNELQHSDSVPDDYYNYYETLKEPRASMIENYYDVEDTMNGENYDEIEEYFSESGDENERENYITYELSYDEPCKECTENATNNGTTAQTTTTETISTTTPATTTTTTAATTATSTTTTTITEATTTISTTATTTAATTTTTTTATTTITEATTTTSTTATTTATEATTTTSTTAATIPTTTASTTTSTTATTTATTTKKTAEDENLPPCLNMLNDNQRRIYDSGKTILVHEKCKCNAAPCRENSRRISLCEMQKHRVPFCSGYAKGQILTEAVAKYFSDAGSEPYGYITTPKPSR